MNVARLLLLARAEHSSACPCLICDTRRGHRYLRAHLHISDREAQGVLVGALQSEREEETRE